MAELKPCPFCGEAEHITVCNVSCDKKAYNVICEKCRSSTGTYGTFSDNGKEQAIAAWNKRVKEGEGENNC